MSATTPMRMASPGPSMASSQAPVQFQPMMAAHSPFMMMGQQPSLDMNAGQMSQFMPIYNLADNQISHRPPPLFDQGERLSEIVDDTKVAQGRQAGRQAGLYWIEASLLGNATQRRGCDAMRY